MNTWRLIHSGFQSGSMNMALDEALLTAVAAGQSPPVLRFYRWRPATVTLGYGQSVATDIDLPACREAGLDVVRRLTGGRAVLHDQEVTYAVIAPWSSPAFGHSVLDCYRVIADVLLATLRQLGLPAALVPGKPRGGPRNVARAVCFSAPSQYELVIEGRKVAGSAQKRQGEVFLQHGSIPLEMDLALLGRVLKTASRPGETEQLASVGWLNHWAAKPFTQEVVETRLAEQFAAGLQCHWQVSEPSAAEQAMALKLCHEKYGHPDWNLKR
ncbi:MAG: lipoate--protein ligase family protein [Desulfuromonadales bacterium]